ncbi:MAG TPA: DNA mismatch repair endonuclease MutL [Tepidisphaeraceae bacterium]|nr:DNA mismatch repair endonuclease MutL [Tepidisphaeraceae bacterium]
MARNPIQQLPAALVNRIAAGEVIERPGSVVKELVENSIDAGATHIAVEVEDGGRALIRIIDDGCGIPVRELPLAFASHATNKLQSDDDLFRIATMGFRGEALASIGAVSQTRLLSRTADDAVAYEINNHGGQIDQAQAAAGNLGTVTEVRNLFFNTPARRKFLKGGATEFGHISDAVIRLAIPHPDVSFQLVHNGRNALELPAAEPRSRWLAAWPEDFADLYLPLEGRDAEISLVGLIGLPELARPVAKHQFFFLNGRPIRDRFIQHALREAYRGLTEPGRHPAAILLLSLPPQDVDVNVHPTKSEVRFRDSSRIHGLVLSAVREKLLGSDLVPSAVPARQFSAPMDDPNREGLRQKLADFFKSAMPEAAPAPLPAQPEMPPELSQPALSSPAQTSDRRAPAIQLHNSYLVAESEDGLIIIDQHALHERIMYEDLLARVSRGPLESQRLLIPLTLPANERQQELLEQIQPLLNRLGIEAAAMGPGAVAVHAFPSFLQRLDPVEFLHEVLERGEQEALDLNHEELLHEILDMMSCKAAVKAGDPLSPAEIEALLARRHLIDRSSNCPHGRPTTLRLSLRDLEKQFKRTGF